MAHSRLALHAKNWRGMCLMTHPIRDLPLWCLPEVGSPAIAMYNSGALAGNREKDTPLQTHPFIVIEGVIGVGKTTLARLLQVELRTEILLEVFEENPFLPLFYTDRARYAFQTQIFFLLSRYRQQHEVVPRTLARNALVSDYSFDKNLIFAHLTLQGDELEMYDRVHAIMAERIPLPDLIVYLRADTDVLMQRIAARDRPYERDMDRGYIDSLNQAYTGFFAAYRQAPVLSIDTNHLNLVAEREHQAYVIQRIRSALGLGTHQPALPLAILPVETTLVERQLPELESQTLKPKAEEDKDLLLEFVTLQAHLGALARELVQFRQVKERLGRTLADPGLAQTQVLEQWRPALRDEIEACMDSLQRIARNAGV